MKDIGFLTPFVFARQLRNSGSNLLTLMQRHGHKEREAAWGAKKES